jgi:hypothetical protein
MNSPFLDTAEQAFSFLEREGFRLSERSADHLRYETGHVSVTINRDPRDGELDVYIGLQPGGGEARDDFSLTDLLAMEGIDAPERRMPFQVFDQAKIAPFLERLAEDTKVHARLALAGDRMFFHRLKAFRNARGRAYRRDIDLRRVRAEAGQAWHNRDFNKLIALYTSIEDDLTASEKAKLSYARQQST